MSSRRPRAIRIISLAGLLLAVVGMAWLGWNKGTTPDTAASTPVPAPPAYAIDFDDPEPSHEVLRHVCDTGGNERTRQLAIVWLDEQARLGQPPPADQETTLLAMLRDNGHPAWDGEYRLWLFNSAFNVLQHSRDTTALAGILHDLATRDPDRTMRLYALQHIGSMRDNARLTGALADEILATLRQLAAAPDSEVAGTAVVLLASWHGADSPADSGVPGQAVAIAVDPGRPVDVRVSALHAAGAHALEDARRLAVDVSQPVILRKAAIACLGRHGDERDFPALETIRREHFRLAQAADPALRTIRHRLAAPDAPALVPF